MTATSNSEFDCAEFALALLEWLDDRSDDEVPAEAGTVDDALELLASERRRLFLQVMRTYGEAITLPDAAEEVAVRETGDAVRELSAERVADVYISLYHDHLPRLVDAGLLDYDQERDLVSPARL
ncbi:hypothetical protein CHINAEXTREME_01365 [Halobiforma lacisalsi AJ5]|uniref:DUF7344 domain-containing protein n=2 Tax=Natronobacterium TaxID=2256 RepID=M0LIA7_NATLA|nr:MULTISPECIES: hypothetical protein [Halobiforma]APW96495.1 hypothetical protein CHINAEXTREME_01365 [Halobiforma lacisalsi AJ5]EMA31730.1 hypothetical protein C445_12985 [Halobiforma lacisalsi AJ5]SFB70125.1 hypothetical protein SAMN05444422_101309 [Halobiforma haloterrestris]